MQLSRISIWSHRHRKGTLRVLFSVLGGVVLWLATAAEPALAATLCVKAGGGGKCFGSIQAAVTAASPGDTINVAHGTYKEDVLITTSISLVGENAENTIIDATGKLDAITVGTPPTAKAPSMAKITDVTISGFTVENADLAGIWVADASFVTISDNRVVNNNVKLVPGSSSSGPVCPPLAGTVFSPGEDFDCGEGIFFSGVDHSIVANNTITRNAGGILVTDDTGASHDNVISSNSVVRNTHLDCGITLPSHSGAGVFQNTVSGNDSSYNGGPGVGIFAPGPGTKAYANVVVNNRLRGNALPGVTMHNHFAAPGLPPANFNDNMIIGNDISANMADEEDTATSGPTGIHVFSKGPITGTVITQNRIHQEALDIVVNVPALGNFAAVQIHLNNLEDKVAIDNETGVRVDATLNWWGCSGGPTANGCGSIVGTNVIFTPWLTKPFQANNGN